MFVVLGEALFDVVEGEDGSWLARPGGSPYNVALGLARLGRPTAFAGRLSRDPLGAILREHAERSGVDLSLAVDATEPSTAAIVRLDADGAARYRFGVDGTADFAWTDAELASIPSDTRAVHFGSLASWLPPAAAAIAERVAELRTAGAFVSYDPNVRPALQPDRTAARATVEATLPRAHLAKVSEEDLDWLRPGEPVDGVARDWLHRGPSAVVVTTGSGGATAYTATTTVTRKPPATTVVDTVGAGDAFTGGLLDALAARDLLAAVELAAAPWPDVLDVANLVAALTCARAGANPPWRHELRSATRA